MSVPKYGSHTSVSWLVRTKKAELVLWREAKMKYQKTDKAWYSMQTLAGTCRTLMQAGKYPSWSIFTGRGVLGYYGWDRAQDWISWRCFMEGMIVVQDCWSIRHQYLWQEPEVNAGSD